jgi:hypothetical protein
MGGGGGEKKDGGALALGKSLDLGSLRQAGGSTRPLLVST